MMVSDVSNWGHDMSTWPVRHDLLHFRTAQPHGSTSDNVDAKQKDPVKSAPSTN